MKKFTLLELMIIVVIISILLTLLLPSVRSARHAGMSAASKSNLSQLYIAFIDYAGNNNGTLPRYRISQTRNVCFWTRELKSYFGPEVAFQVMRMPGVEYLPGQWSGYSASHAITGFRDNKHLDNKFEGRKILSIENPGETYLLFEGIAGTAYNAEGRVTWSQLQTDKSAASSQETHKLNFFYNERMNWLNVNGAASTLHFKFRQKIDNSHWQGL